MTASPQPGNQDERHPDEWCFDCGQKHSKCECYPYDADLADRQTGAGEEADEVSAIRPGCGTTPLLAEFRRRHPILTEDDQPAPSAGQDTGQMRDVEEECSAACVQRICEWCPGQDRFEGVAQWLYKAVIARQDRIPADDVRPWSDLSKDQRNGWRGWATELLELTDGPLRQLIAERDDLRRELDQARAQVQRVEALAEHWSTNAAAAKGLTAKLAAYVAANELRNALGRS